MAAMQQMKMDLHSAGAMPVSKAPAASSNVGLKIAGITVACLVLFAAMLAAVIAPGVVMKLHDTAPKVIPQAVLNLDPASGTSVNPEPVVVAPPEVDSPAQLVEAFASVSGQQVERFCRPFAIAGFNSYDLVETAMVTTNNYQTVGNLQGVEIIRQAFQVAAGLGLNVVRTWGQTTTSKFEFQISPGVYNPAGLAALDNVLELARQNGMQVILTFIDNWTYYNGVDQYVDWSATVPPRPANEPVPVDSDGDPTPQDYPNQAAHAYEAGRHALFWTDPQTTQFYMNHVKFMIMRNNTINGRLYRDDPTIFAWNLVNEPRCETWVVPNCTAILQGWLTTMSAYVRSLDPKHMITVGSEGFFGSEDNQYNNQTWFQQMGQDFVTNSQLPDVDYMTVHSWPADWDITDSIDFIPQWLKYHLQVGATQVKKPVLFEEFGCKLDARTPTEISTLRDPVFQITYNAVTSALAQNNSNMLGALFWRLSMPVFLDAPSDVAYGVQYNDTTMGIIQNYAQVLRNYVNAVPSRPECNFGAWYGVTDPTTGKRSCINLPGTANLFYAMANGTANATNGYNSTEIGYVQQLQAGQTLVFPSQFYCCQAGVGAFDAGCTVANA